MENAQIKYFNSYLKNKKRNHDIKSKKKKFLLIHVLIKGSD